MKLFLFLFLCGLCSCFSLKPKTAVPDRKVLHDLSDINGTYEVDAVNHPGTTLESAISFNDYYTYYNPPSPGDKIELKKTRQHRLLLTVYDGDSVVAKQKLRASLADNYLEFTQERMKPFWLVLNSYQRIKGRIAINPAGNIIVEQKSTATVFFSLYHLRVLWTGMTVCFSKRKWFYKIKKPGLSPWHHQHLFDSKTKKFIYPYSRK